PNALPLSYRGTGRLDPYFTAACTSVPLSVSRVTEGCNHRGSHFKRLDMNARVTFSNGLTGSPLDWLGFASARSSRPAPLVLVCRSGTKAACLSEDANGINLLIQELGSQAFGGG